MNLIKNLKNYLMVFNGDLRAFVWRKVFIIGELRKNEGIIRGLGSL